MVSDSVFSKLLAELEDKIVGLDHCFSKLHEIVRRFVKSNEGGSAIIIGPKLSGKRSVIRKVVMDYADTMEVIFIDGLIQLSDAESLKLLNTTNSDPQGQLQFVTVFNFDQFVAHGRQAFIYKLLNASRSGPVFALCVSSRQDCIELLEKRVRSRLSNICISFAQPSMTFDDFLEAFTTFLHTKKSDNENHNRCAKAFVKEAIVQHNLREVYDETRSYCILKQITATFLCFMDAEQSVNLSSTHALRIFNEAKNSVIATEDTMKSIILSLTLRQLCLLLCCVRLVRHQRQQDFTFREIIQSYRKLVNTYLPMLSVKDDLILLKELDTLCSLTVLEDRGQHGQLAFRRTALQVDIDLVLNSLKEFTPLPTVVMRWVDDLEK